MSEAANVRSLDALRDFKGALQQFEESASGALDALQQETFRAIDWFEHDRPSYWKHQVERGYNRVAESRTAYET